MEPSDRRRIVTSAPSKMLAIMISRDRSPSGVARPRAWPVGTGSCSAFALVFLGPKKTSAKVEQLPVPTGQKLPTPSLGGPPPKGCDPSIMIAGVYDGAEVTILRLSDGSTETSTFDSSTGSTSCSAHPSRTRGDKLEIRQAMRDCRERQPSDPLLVDVAPAEKPGTPALMAPCPGSVDVFVTNLEGGCRVKVTYKGKTYRGTVPPSATLVRLSSATAGRNRNDHRGSGTMRARQRCRIHDGPRDQLCTRAAAGSGGTLVRLRSRRPRAGDARGLAAGLGQNASRPDADQQSDICDEGLGSHPRRPISQRRPGSLARLFVVRRRRVGRIPPPCRRCGSPPGSGEYHFAAIENTSSVTVDAVPGAAVNVFAITGMPIKVELIGLATWTRWYGMSG